MLTELKTHMIDRRLLGLLLTGCRGVCSSPPSKAPRRPVRMQMVTQSPTWASLLSPWAAGTNSSTDSVCKPEKQLGRQLWEAEWGLIWGTARTMAGCLLVPCVSGCRGQAWPHLAWGTFPGAPNSPVCLSLGHTSPSCCGRGEGGQRPQTCVQHPRNMASWVGGQRTEASHCDPGQVTPPPLPTDPWSIYKWPLSIWKDVQHYHWLGKCKLKPQLDATPHPLEWL